MKGGVALAPASGDDGGGGGIGMGTPLGAEAAGDLAKDDTGPQRPLAVVVGGGDVAAGDEEEQIATAFAEGRGALSSRRRRQGWLRSRS